MAGWRSAAEGLYIARARHVEALQAAAAHLQEATRSCKPRPALDLLAEELRLAHNPQLGASRASSPPDDLLGVIFSSFCIGK